MELAALPRGVFELICVLSETTHPDGAPRSAPATAVLNWRRGVGRRGIVTHSNSRRKSPGQESRATFTPDGGGWNRSQTARPLRSASPLHSSSHCSRRFGDAPAGRFSSQPTYVYAYARHSVADCPQGQLCDPAPPRSCGAPRGIAQGDVHAAPALHATLFRARRVALSVPAVLGLPAFALLPLAPLACTRFRRHRVRCLDGAGGGSWRDGSLPASSSLRLCA